MDIIMIVLAVVIAYVVFITMTYWLAHLFFPKIDVDDEELDTIAELRDNVKKIKDRFNRSKSFAMRH